jgi:hypothetical protein
MRRRLLVAIPGFAALAATHAFGHGEEASETSVGTSPVVSKKALLKQATSKAGYDVPKNPVKQARYIQSLTALLSLTAAQQAQATSIYTTAVNNRAGIHATMKSLRGVLNTAVQNNDGSGISQASAQMGSLMAQFVLNGAQANSTFFQILNPSQQSILVQYQGRITSRLA